MGKKRGNQMKPLEDYSDIRGFCYSGGYRVPEEQLKRELGYAGSLRLNSTRIWLSEREYRKAPGDFLKKLCTFVETAWEAGISTMPILFNGNGLDPGDLEQGYEEYAERRGSGSEGRAGADHVGCNE